MITGTIWYFGSANKNMALSLCRVRFYMIDPRLQQIKYLIHQHYISRQAPSSSISLLNTRTFCSEYSDLSADRFDGKNTSKSRPANVKKSFNRPSDSYKKNNYRPNEDAYEFEQESSYINARLKENTKSSRAKDKGSENSKLNRKQWLNTFGSLVNEEDFNKTINRHNSDETEQDYEKDSDPGGHFRLSKTDRDNIPWWYDNQIEKLGKQRKVKEALEIFEERMLKRDRVMPTKFTFDLLITMLAKEGYIDKAFQMYNRMKKMGFKGDGITYSSLFNACGNAANKEKALKQAHLVAEIMHTNEWRPNFITLAAMMKAHGRCGDIETCFSIMDEITKRFPLQPSVFGTLLNACVMDKDNGLRLTIEVWRLMIEHKVKPDLKMYNMLLRGVRDCSIQYTDGLMLIDQNNSNAVNKTELSNLTVCLLPDKSHQSTSNLPSTTLAENSLQETANQLLCQIDFSKRENRLALFGGCENIVRNMELDGINADIRTFSMILDNTEQTVQAEENLLSLMKEHGVKPDQEFMNSLIRKRVLRNEHKNARLVVAIMSKFQITPNMETFQILAKTCSKVTDGLQLLDDIDRMDSEANHEVFVELFRASHMDFQYKCRLLTEIDKLNIKPKKDLISVIEEKIALGNKKLVQLEKKSGNQGNSEANKRAWLPHLKRDFQEFMHRYSFWLHKSEIAPSEKFLKPWMR